MLTEPTVEDLHELLEYTNSELFSLGNELIIVTGPYPGLFTNFVEVFEHLAEQAGPRHSSH